MPGFDPISSAIGLGLGVVSAVPKVIASIKQKKLANNLKLTDRTPEAFKEQLAGLRLGAATSRMPGMGAAENKLAQNFAAGAGAATRAGGSGADILASISALGAQRQQGQSALNTQGLQYQDAAKQRLNAGLAQQAGYQQQSQQAYEREKAALIQSSNQNLQNAVDGIAGGAAFGLSQVSGGGAPADPMAGLSSLPSTGNPFATGLGNYGRARRPQRAVGVY